MNAEDECAVIARAKQGDAAAFETLVTANERMVYGVALRLLGNEQDAQDAAQEVFLKAYLSLSDFRGDSRFSTWLCRITSNICIDMRRKKELPTVSLSTGEEDGTELQLSDGRFLPEDELEKKELYRAVQRGLESLPSEYRHVLVLREIAGQSYDEIGRILSLESGTVKSRIFRARKKLCAILAADGNFSENNPSNPSKGGVQE